MDIDKPNALIYAFKLATFRVWTLSLYSSVKEVLEPCCQCTVRLECAIIAVRYRIALLRFEPTSWGKRFKGLLRNLCLVGFPTTARCLRVDVIKGVTVIPRFGAIKATSSTGS